MGGRVRSAANGPASAGGRSKSKQKSASTAQGHPVGLTLPPAAEPAPAYGRRSSHGGGFLGGFVERSPLQEFVLVARSQPLARSAEAAAVKHHQVGGHEDRAHDERVQQHAEGQREAELD